MNSDLLKTFWEKISIFSTELRHASLKKVKRLFSRPEKGWRYLGAFFKYKMIFNPKLSAANSRLKNSSNSFLLFGDFEELHNRIAGKNDYKRCLRQIKKLLSAGQEVKIVLGLSRYNFARLNKLAELATFLLGKKADFSAIQLKVFPAKDLPANFMSYLGNIEQQVANEKISIVFFDEQLMEILNTVGLHAKVEPGREKDLLRLLGIISEQVFIGPQTIVFDPFHRCNTKCQHCWVHTPQVKHPEEFLNRKFDFELFKQIIDDASAMLTDGIILQGDGEPLMYEQFMPMLRYARSKQLGVLFFTNGILLDEEKAKEVIGLGVNEIYCSFPAGSPDTYAKISSVQPPDTFFKVRDNLKKFMELRRASGENQPRLIVSHVIHNMNYHELVEMAKMDAKIAPDAVRFYLIRLDVMNRFLQLSPQQIVRIKEQIPEVADILRKNQIEFIDNFEFQLNHYDAKTGAWSKDFFLNQGCTIGWYFNLIPAKYDMSFCCHLRTVGYLDKKAFKDIWNSVEYWRWRRQAKYLKNNQAAKFANGQQLYDEHCDHCDNHQTIIRTLNELKKFNLFKYY